MKKITGIIVALFAGAMLFSCANTLDSATESNGGESREATAKLDELSKTADVKVNVLYADASKSWNVWAWKGGTEINYSTKGWPGDLVLTKNGSVFSRTLSVDANYDLGLLFVASSGSPQTKDITITKENLVAGAEFWFIYDDTTVYSSEDECTGLKGAKVTTEDGNTVVLRVFGMADATKDSFTVTGSDGTGFTVSSVTASSTSATIKLSDGDIKKIPYKVSYGEIHVTANITSDLIDELGMKYDGDDLGLTLDGNKATFKVWAPLASEVSLLLYSGVENVGNFKPATVAAKASGSCDEAELRGTPAIDPIEMEKDNATGVWSYELTDYSPYKYYKYQIVNDGTTYYVCDINAKAASPDSIAAQIVDINADGSYGTKAGYVNPFGSSGSEPKSYSDAVIYEMHIRDWSKAVGGDGKFLDLAESEEFIAHLKDIGITHVQVVPMFDYAQVNADPNYNWGYNPYHYNVPEGRYVKDMRDGTDSVEQMRKFIKALHEAGIAVNMDVVYNHTSGTLGGSLYDSTVPGYFYRMDSSGSYSNGSGCGNETATNHYMVRKYVIDSLKHWMLDYHINGFRFDLMGVHEKETMKEIYDELYKIDPNVMVYGEPWTGGTASVKDGAVCAGVGTNGLGYGAFDDDFRDAIKGAEYGGFKQGHVQGTFSDDGIIKGLTGVSGTNKRNETGKPALALHYVECHDNYTLFDKLAISYLGKTSYSGDLFNAIGKDGLDAVKAQDKLAAAYVMLSQGTPFINGGQEFLRTKKGNENSYQSDDTINAINLEFKEKYADVYAVYKGLIALRKDYSAFRNATSATAEKLTEGVTLYNVTADDGNFTVVFNATSKQATITPQTGKVVDVGESLSATGLLGLGFKNLDISKVIPTKGYTIADAETKVSSVPAKSFVIIKK